MLFHLSETGYAELPHPHIGLSTSCAKLPQPISVQIEYESLSSKLLDKLGKKSI